MQNVVLFQDFKEEEVKSVADFVVCIFFVPQPRGFDSLFQEELKKRFSFILEVKHTTFINLEGKNTALVLYGKTKLFDRDKFQAFLNFVIDDFLLSRTFVKVFVIFCNSDGLLEAVETILGTFFFLYQRNLLSAPGYFNVYTEKFIREKYDGYLSLRNKVSKAIDSWREGIEIHSQPIFLVRDGSEASTEMILYGYEILSRIVDFETQDLVYPRSYFEVLHREPELSMAFQEKVLRRVLEIVPSDVSYRIHVNFTLDFLQDSYSFLLFLKEKKKVDFLAIEVVEYSENPSSLFLTKEESLKVLRKLQSRGYPVILDDFFEGISNFSVLLDFLPDGLKISKNVLSYLKYFCLLDASVGQNGSASWLSGVCKVLREYRSKASVSLFAEGIETFDDLNITKKLLGAEFYQGFYFGKPSKLNFHNLRKEEEKNEK